MNAHVVSIGEGSKVILSKMKGEGGWYILELHQQDATRAGEKTYKVMFLEITTEQLDDLVRGGVQMLEEAGKLAKR